MDVWARERLMATGSKGVAAGRLCTRVNVADIVNVV